MFWGHSDARWWSFSFLMLIDKAWMVVGLVGDGRISTPAFESAGSSPARRKPEGWFWYLFVLERWLAKSGWNGTWEWAGNPGVNCGVNRNLKVAIWLLSSSLKTSSPWTPIMPNLPFFLIVVRVDCWNVVTGWWNGPDWHRCIDVICLAFVMMTLHHESWWVWLAPLVTEWRAPLVTEWLAPLGTEWPASVPLLLLLHCFARV